MIEWPPASHEPILAKIGTLLLEWNSAERAMRSLITAMFERSHASLVLTAEMDNRELCNALNSVAQEFMEEDERICTAHLVKYIERVREYRNYYVHGFSTIGVKDGKPAAILTTWSAKSRLAVHQYWFNAE